jgi:hypothetical protein
MYHKRKDDIVKAPLHSNISPVAAWALHEVVFYRVAAEAKLNFGGRKTFKENN